MSAFIRKHIQELAAYIPGEQPDDPDVIKLNTNENPYPPAPGVKTLLQKWSWENLARYPDPVCSALRRELAQYHGCAENQIFVGNGSDEVLALSMKAFVHADGQAGWFSPSYSLYPVLAAIENLSTRPVPLGPDFSWVMPPLDELDCFFLTTPNAPTGIQYSREQIESCCGQKNAVIVLDEAYVDFAEDEFSDIALRHEHVLVTRTFSKSFSLAGIRLGYALGHQDLIEALMKIKDSYNVDAISQAIGCAAVREASYMREMVARIKHTREHTREALLELGMDVVPSATNFLWVRPACISAEELFLGLQREKILVRYFKDAVTQNYIRITIGTDEEMETLISAVRRLCRQNNAK